MKQFLIILLVTAAFYGGLALLAEHTNFVDYMTRRLNHSIAP